MGDTTTEAASAPDAFVRVTLPIGPQYFCELNRYKIIARLCAYYDGDQYKGRPDFWKGKNGRDGQAVPLRERAPCVIYPLPKAATQQAVRFTFGDGRYPVVKVEPADKDSSVADLELSKDEATVSSNYLAEVTEQVGLRPTMRTLLRHGLSAKTAVAILAVRDGRFAIDIAHAKDCWPTFRNGDPSSDVESLVWCYRFSKMVVGKDGRPEYKDHFFRRDITAKAVIVYFDTEVPDEPTKEPEWQIDTATSKAHELGFCPVIWIRNMAEQCSGDIDGMSLYEGLEDEFDALNFALSQRHRGVVIFGVPQPWETGVEEGDGPSASARTAAPARNPLEPSAAAGFSNGRSPHGDVASTTPARPIDPTGLWSFAGEKVTLGLLETTGKAFEVATAHVNDVRQRILEAMSVVLINAAEVSGKGHMSAKFLAMVYQDLLSLVDDLRPTWWHYGLSKILCMILRMTAVLGGDRILVPGAGKVAEIMGKRHVAFEGGTVWVPPKLTPAWGDYFSLSNDEIKAGVDAAVAAKEGKIIPTTAATEFVAPYFGIDDIDEAVADLAKEADEAQANALSLGHAMNTINGNEDPSGSPGSGGASQTPSSTGGGDRGARSDLPA